MNVWILGLIILAIAATMTMSGRGGGNFYVLALALAGVEMHIAATTGQFILVASTLMATFFFNKKKITDWKLFLFIGSMTLVSAFLGGFFSDIFNGKMLKFIFAAFITIASLLMFKPVKKSNISKKYKNRYVLVSGNETYHINLFLTIPVVLLSGFVSGMVGVSGGSFLVPLMVLAIDVPIQIAVATSTALVLVTASAGFLGHLGSGHFDYKMAIPLAIFGLIGGMIGARFTLSFNPKTLKTVFAVTSLIAAIIMVYKAIC